MNETQREYYFNLDYNKNSEYQKYANRVKLSTTRIVSGDIEPCVVVNDVRLKIVKI